MTEFAELMAAEPVLARVFRARVEDRHLVIAHTIDTGRVAGTVDSVTDDGTVATIVQGRDVFEVDVEKVCVVQTVRREAD